MAGHNPSRFKTISMLLPLLLLLMMMMVGEGGASPDSDDIEVANTTFPTTIGGTLNLTCTSQEDHHELVWGFGGPDEENITRLQNSYKYEIRYEDGGSESYLTVKNVQRSDEGMYFCYDDKSRDHDFYKFDMPLGPEMMISDGQPDKGDVVTIMCKVVGHLPKQIDWTYTGTDDIVRNPIQFKAMFGNQVYVESKTNRTGSYLELLFYNIEIEKSGLYTCMSEGKSQSRRLHVHGHDIHCQADTLYVELSRDALFSCTIVTLTPFNRTVIDVKKHYQSSKDLRALDPKRETYHLRKDNSKITTYFELHVDSVMTSDDGTTYKVFLPDIFFEVNLMIELPTIYTCRGQACPNNLICSKSYECICPVGMMPSTDIKAMCINDKGGRNERNQDAENGDSESLDDGGDVTIVKHASVATAVGVSMGVLGFIILIILGFVCYWRRKKHRLNTQARGHYLDPSYLYQYEYHSEANMLKENPTVCNPGYLVPPLRRTLRKENTYVDTERARLEFPREQLQLGVDLGQGRFGKVIQARAMNITGSGTWERVAVKTCRGTATDSEKQDLYQELEIMRKIPAHPNVALLLGCCSKTDPLYIIMEYVQRGSMLNYLRKCRPSSRVSSRDSAISSLQTNSSFMEPRAKDLSIFALQIARGMAHIGTCGIIHRDLAARNILLGTDFTCKICDFGLARDVEGVDVYERTSKGPLPIRWMAPEALAENMYTKKSDVWSYGVLLWEIVTLGATPYTGMSAMEVMRHVLQGYNLPRPLHCKEEMYELMERCWTDSEERPTFADIVTHHEALMDDDYIILSDYDENDYGWLDSFTLDERV